MEAINIKGKRYFTVNQRLLHLRKTPELKKLRIVEDVIELNEKEGVFKVSILDENDNVITSAHAQEYRDSSYINKTSFLENGFTSALGRALGYLGIGIDTSIASAEEMVNALNNQNTNKTKINSNQYQNARF